eukprot:gene4148-7458_t
MGKKTKQKKEIKQTDKVQKVEKKKKEIAPIDKVVEKIAQTDSKKVVEKKKKPATKAPVEKVVENKDISKEEEGKVKSKILLKDLTMDVTTDDISKACSTFGKVKKAQKISEKEGIIIFEDDASYKKALEAKTVTVGKLQSKISAVVKKDKDNYSIEVSDLPMEIEEATLKKYLTELGKIKSIIFLGRTNTKAAFVTFTQKLNESKVLEYDKATIEGNVVSIRLLTSQDKSVFVTKISPTTTEEVLKEYFSEAGEIVSVTKTSNFSATVTFKDYESVKEILEYNGADIEGRPVSIFREVPRFFSSNNKGRGGSRGGRGGARGGRGRF